MTRLLDNELLDRFDDVLASQPGDLLRRVGEGPSDHELHAAFDGLAVTPTEEVLRWLGRHHWGGAFVLPGVEAFDFRGVVEGYHLMLGLAVEVARQGPDANEQLANPDYYWSPHWLMIFSLGGLPKLAIDCEGPIDGPSPVRLVSWDGIGDPDFAAAFAPSLGRYIEDACDALERGHHRYDPDKETWLPMDWAMRPIVLPWSERLQRRG